MSYESNVPAYIKLIKEFCQKKISAELFNEKYFKIWSDDRDEVYSRTTDIWPRRYDIELANELKKGKISTETFNQKWDELFGNTPLMAKIRDILDRIYTACDCFYSDISDDELNPPIVINGDMLREEVTILLQELEEILKSEKI
ncbi:MAG: colicin immunity domain-containing protein [Planctomycetaceae bacterium]|jgi:hypothetical protein|nr:colicin immunity domain-containing protein [Planctomycetaceae bacterium]